MSKKLHTVTHPDGTVSTRRSDHDYQYAVVLSTSAWEHARNREAQLAQYRRWLAAAEEQGDAAEVARYTKSLADVEALPAPTTTYGVPRWSSTRKAAEAAARSFGGHVVEVDPTGGMS